MEVLLLLLLLITWNANDVLSKRKKDSVSIIFGGDVDFSRILKYNHHKRNCSYAKSFEGLVPWFMQADFTMVNLETTIEEKIDKSPLIPEGIHLKSEESVIPALKEVGIRYVTLANNHMSDYCERGVRSTRNMLEKHGIKYVGIVEGEDHYGGQKPVIIEKNGIKIGVLGYCHLRECLDGWEKANIGPALTNISTIINEVNLLREKDNVDVVVLFFHWGVEYTSVIDTGVIKVIRNLLRKVKIDLIVGSHPHITQHHWYVNNTLVAQSLGNLLFSPHSLANLNFNEARKDNLKKTKEEMYESLWYTQMQVMKDPSMYGKLIKVEFNKNGIVKEKSKYILTKIFATKKGHCLSVAQASGSAWNQICDPKGADPECTGTPSCNYIECNQETALPESLRDTPYIEFPKFPKAPKRPKSPKRPKEHKAPIS